MENKKIKEIFYNEEGSTVGFFVMVLLAITVMATATVTLAQTQFAWAQSSRQTSNSYELARSGAEKTIDSMNKEIAMVLPKVMAEASENAYETLMADDNMVYEKGLTAYDGEYKGGHFHEQYEKELKRLLYDHIVTKFASGLPNKSPVPQVIFEANKSDVKGAIKIKVQTKIYKYGDKVPKEVLLATRGLLNPSDIGSNDKTKSEKSKDAFAVEVLAWAQDATQTSITKARVVGAIRLDQEETHEKVLEEYEWTDRVPEIFQSAITSCGDLINVEAFTKNHQWTRNNPIKVIREEGPTKVNISDYENRPTAIIATHEDAIIELISSEGNREFTGIIASPGKIIIRNEMTIHGVVIGGVGEHPNLQIEADKGVIFDYDSEKEEDRNIILEIRFIDKELQRRLYDYCGMTNYGAGGLNGDMDKIFGPFSNRSIKISPKSIIMSSQEGLKFTMRSLKNYRSLE